MRDCRSIQAHAKKMKRFCGTGKHEDVSKSGKTSVSPSPVSAPLQDGASSEPMRPRGGGKIHSRASGLNTGHGTKSMARLAIGKRRDIVMQFETFYIIFSIKNCPI